MSSRNSLNLGLPPDSAGGHWRDVPRHCRTRRIHHIDGRELDRTAIAYHITMRLADGRGLARGPAELRRATRILYEQGDARGLLAFRIADTHAHVLLAAGRSRAGEFARYVESALRQALALPVPFEPARIRPVAEPRHLANAVRYLFRQEEHHRTCLDPEHDGSSLPDLLGMRAIGAAGTVARVRQLLPRLTRVDLIAWLAAGPFESAQPDVTLAADAAAAALALTTFAGRSHDHRRARLAAVHLFGGELNAARVSAALGLCSRTVERLRSRPVEPALLRAAHLQLCLRTTLHTRVLAAFA